MRVLDHSLRSMQRIVLLLSLLCLTLTAATAAASAHGGGTPQVVDVPAGPYRIFVWTSPDPWREEELAHVTVAVTRVDAAGQVFPLTDVRVTVRLFSETQPDQAVTLLAQPVSAVATGFYEVDYPLPEDGLWRIEIEALGAEGVGAVAFTMVAEPAASARWPVWAGVAFAAAIVAFAVLQTARRRSPRRNPQRGQEQSVERRGARPASFPEG